MANVAQDQEKTKKTVKRSVWEALPVRAEPSAAAQTLFLAPISVDTPLVLICPVGGAFAVYWSAEISTVIVRAMAAASVNGLSEALRCAARLVQDVNAAAVILDLSEAPLISGAHFQDTVFIEAGISSCLTVIVGLSLTEETAENPTSLRFASLTLAFERLRSLCVPCDSTDVTAEILTRRGAELIVGTYAGCAYWLPRSKTLALLWSGDEADTAGMDAVYDGVAEYTRYLRIEAVILDIRNHIHLETYNRVRLQNFIDATVFRGVYHFAIVGSATTLCQDGDPVAAYLDALVAVTQVELVGSFEEALHLNPGPQDLVELNS